MHRSVCAASVQKIQEKGKLNKFVVCAESPLPNEIYCATHLVKKDILGYDRLDVGRITRSKRKELGTTIHPN